MLPAVFLMIAQAGAAPPEPPALQLHAWLDVFYAWNTNRPADGASFLPGTGTTARRANELNLNAAALDVAVDPRPVGAHLTLAFGSGPDVLHAGEPQGSGIGPSVWRNVYQASVAYMVPLGSGLLLEGLDPYGSSIELGYGEAVEGLVVSILLIAENADCNRFPELDAFNGIRAPMHACDVSPRGDV